MSRNHTLASAITLILTTSVGSHAEQFQNVTADPSLLDPAASNSATKLYAAPEFDFITSYFPAQTLTEGTSFATELFGNSTSILPPPNTETGEYMAVIYTIYGTIDKDFEMTFTLDKGRFAAAMIGIRSSQQTAGSIVTGFDPSAWCVMSAGDLTTLDQVFKFDAASDTSYPYQVAAIGGGHVTFWQLGERKWSCPATGVINGTSRVLLSSDATASSGLLRRARNASTGVEIGPATTVVMQDVTTGNATLVLNGTGVASKLTPGWRYICADPAMGGESAFAELLPVFEVKGTTTVSGSDGVLVSVLPATTAGTGGNSFGGFATNGYFCDGTTNNTLYRVNAKNDTVISIADATKFTVGKTYKFDGGGTTAVPPYSNVHTTAYRITATDTTKNTVTIDPPLAAYALLHGEFAYDTKAFTIDPWSTKNAVAAEVVGQTISDAVNYSSFSVLLKASTPGLTLYPNDQIMLLYKLTDLGALATANETVKMNVELTMPITGLPISPAQELVIARSIQEAKPEIDVQGKGISISNGDTTPDLNDHTDFGLVSLGSSPDHVFTLHNRGGGTLKINDISLSGPGCSAFSKVFPLLSELGPNQSTSLQVTFISTSKESSDCTVRMDNSDSDENPYTFNLTGQGYIPALLPSNPTLPSASNLGITLSGNGTGTVRSDDKQIECNKAGGTCQATYNTGAVVTLIPTADSGSYFSSWSGQEDCSDGQVQMLSGVSCIAYFSKKPSELIINKEGEGTVTGRGIHCGEECKESYLAGTEVTLTATPLEGWQLTEWRDGCQGAELQTQVTLDDATTCTAVFEKAPDHRLTIQKSGSGTGTVTATIRGTPTLLNCGETCVEDYLYGSAVTLKATPDADSKFVQWYGEGCGETVQLTEDKTCYAEFASLLVPSIQVWQTTVNFEAPHSTSKVTQTIPIYSGDWLKGHHLSTALQLGLITVDNPAFVLKDTCSNTEIAPWHACHLEVEFSPQSAEPTTATLSIPSDAPETPIVTVTLNGQVCSSENPSQPSVSFSPTLLDFGIQPARGSSSLTTQAYISIPGQGCGMPQIDTLQLTGPHASEFSFKDQQCYHGQRKDNTLSFCQGTVVFSPTSEGQKEAYLNVIFNDPRMESVSVPIQAQASMEFAQLEILPQDLVDFGTLPLGQSKYERVTIKNIGNVNLELHRVYMSGEAFTVQNLWNCWQSYNPWTWVPSIPPDGQCQIMLQFSPLTTGDQQGMLTLNSNDPGNPTVQIPLQGKSSEPQYCLESLVTIESVSSGLWGTGSTWNTGLSPTESDVVRIKEGHTITGTAYAKVKTLCIEPQATLESPDERGSPLWIQASDYIQNQGTVRGKDGQAETEGTSLCTSNLTVGIPTCAQHGASIFLQAGSYWWNVGISPHIINKGNIIAGNGGAGTQYGGQGGEISISGGGVWNLSEDDEGGVIQAGKGGDLTGTQAGQAGRGGNAQVSGYDRISGNGGLFMAGNGGNCNPNATIGQIGGNGGTQRWWGSTVNLQGTFLMGKGGTHCQPLGIDGRDGQFTTDPNIISLSGAHTRIEGGNVTIFGGKDWVLDLSNLDHPVVQATGDIVLAVGKGGMIDLRGNQQTILKAQGQATIFSDSILLDEGKTLHDAIAAQNIVVAPSKILHEFSLTASEKVIGSPGTTVPVVVMLNNSGPEQDTYVLKVTDSKGWPLGSVPESVTVEGLSAIQMAFNVILPSTRGEMNRIQVSATSQADPNVSATQEIQVGVAMSDAEVMVPLLPQAISSSLEEREPHPVSPSLPGEDSPSSSKEILPSSSSEGQTAFDDSQIHSPSSTEENPISPDITQGSSSVSGQIVLPAGIPSPVKLKERCPPTGMINELCDNRNHIIKDATLGPRALLSGGTLAGTIHNQGFVSQVTIQPETILTGGTFSGRILNQGTMLDITFVGILLEGGTLGGTTMNVSKVGGIISDVMFAAHARLQGGKLKGQIQGDQAAPALLENVKILKGSQLSGVTLGKGVILEEGVTVE